MSQQQSTRQSTRGIFKVGQRTIRILHHYTLRPTLLLTFVFGSFLGISRVSQGTSGEKSLAADLRMNQNQTKSGEFFSSPTSETGSLQIDEHKQQLFMGANGGPSVQGDGAISKST
jgi:hypothetical protein